MWLCVTQICNLLGQTTGYVPCADDGPLLRDSQVQAVLGSNMLPVFRLLHAQVAAAAAVLAKNIRAATGHLPVSSHSNSNC